MKVAIIGYGFVGEALSSALKKNVKIFKVDPKLKTSIKDLKSFKPDITFLCLPTPMMDDGSQDVSILTNSLKELLKNKISGLIVVKSTVHPGNINLIKEVQPKLIYNPEFLREKYAEEDFINSQLIVFGGDSDDCKYLSTIYKEYTNCICKDHIFTDEQSASMIKYTINSFLATKVIFFNELYELFNQMDSNEIWANFISYIAKDSRIGESHMMVPGHDGRYGFGGACLPKDASAIVHYANNMNIELNILKKTIETNNEIRSSYDKKIDREDEQNIKFKNFEKE